MFKRKIELDLLNWFNNLNNSKVALIIKGLRQIGKTTSVKDFCVKHFENVIYINFLFDTEIKKFFDGDLNVDRLVMILKAYNSSFKFVENKTVIIFDEIQECPNARTAIKPFMIDGRYDIIATGSLLGLRGYNAKAPRSIPVGFESIIEMKPMDFEEFLWAKGVDEDVIGYIKDCFINSKPVEDSINKIFHNYLKEYLCVGGMPKAISEFIKTNDFNKSRKVLKDLLNSYKDDFGKHLNLNDELITNKVELQRIEDVFTSIPNQLANENKKFTYSDIKPHAKGREYLNAIVWLEEYGLAKRCYRLNNLQMPLKGNVESNIFKIYFADTGLFLAMLDENIYFKLISDNLGIYKGAIYENLVAESLIKNSKELYYYNKSDQLEIDFVTNYLDKITLLEVKSSNNKSTSLNKLINNNSTFGNYKLINGNIGHSNNINTIPLYMSFLIK